MCLANIPASSTIPSPPSKYRYPPTRCRDRSRRRGAFLQAVPLVLHTHIYIYIYGLPNSTPTFHDARLSLLLSLSLSLASRPKNRIRESIVLLWPTMLQQCGVSHSYPPPPSLILLLPLLLPLLLLQPVAGTLLISTGAAQPKAPLLVPSTDIHLSIVSHAFDVLHRLQHCGIIPYLFCASAALNPPPNSMVLAQ